MRKSFIKISFFMLTAAAVFFAMPSCDLVEDPDDVQAALDNLGWYGIDNEDTTNIENDISFGSGSIPASVDLSDQFPPIGNQGSYGTCVAWAVGYNHKAYLEAKDKEYTTSDMSSQSKQFSPKYLFWAIPSSQKGADCNGTGFEPAYDVMLSKGIPTMADVPYDNLGDCSGSTSSWDGNAADYKIESYRQVNVNKQTIKEYLANGRVLSIGAQLGENFMSWNSSSVLQSDTEDYNGQHAYHAMALSGYDDSKGPNGAFRVVNSWGTGWGDNGFIWVDQDFFVEQFCFCAFVATNIRSNPDDDGNDEVDDLTDGKDLLAWEIEDEQNSDYSEELKRIVYYDVFNSGTETIYANEDWAIFYIYYNAYDAEDWDIMLYDYYSDDYGNSGENGFLESGGDGIVDNWWNYVNVEPGRSVAQSVYGGDESRFQWSYTMPEITGEYYLVIVADGYDVIEEVDEDNNYYFLTDTNGEPLTFQNGIMQETPAKKSGLKKVPSIGAPSPSPTARTANNLNAYSPQEIQAMIEYHKETGRIAEKAAVFQKTNKSGGKKVDK